MADSRRSVPKSALRVLGTLVFAGALGYVAIRIRDSWGLLAERSGDVAAGWIVPAGGLAYAVLSMCLAAPWLRFLHFAGARQVDPLTGYRIYARSQIAKYLPGNVFHLASRHLLGVEAGATHTALVAAALLEAVGLIAAACAVSCMGLVLYSPPDLGHQVFLYALGVLAALLVPLVLKMGMDRLGSLIPVAIPECSLLDFAKRFFGSFAAYCLFFAGSGAILIWLVHLGTPCGTDAPALSVMGVYATAWMAGFVTPGAPAGLGVRETVMMIWLDGMLGEGPSLLVVLLFRLVTVCGDFFFFVASLVLSAFQTIAGKET